MRRTTITIRDDQLTWIEQNKWTLSSFVQKKIDEEMDRGAK